MNKFQLTRGGKIVRFHAYLAWVFAVVVFFGGFSGLGIHNKQIDMFRDESGKIDETSLFMEYSLGPVKNSRSAFIGSWLGLAIFSSCMGALLYVQSERHQVAPQPTEPNR